MKRCARCEWQASTDDREQAQAEAVDHALDAAHPLCGTCARSLAEHEAGTCERCIDRARQHLREVVELFALLPAELGQLRGTGYDRDGRGVGDEHRLPGGDVLVLLAGGSDGLRQRDGKRDERESDPQPLAHALSTWAVDWQETRGEFEPVASVATAAGYLERHLRWAAVTHPAFPEFSEELRDHASRLRAATGRSQRPVRAPADCFDCGGALERHWTDAGLAEEWTCAQCGETYDHARYFLAVRAQLERRGA